MKTSCTAILAACFVVLARSPAAAQCTGGTAGDTVETVREGDLNGAVGVSERVVTHRSRSGDEDQMIIEIYRPSIEAGRLALSRRVRRVTMVTSDGCRTVEATEAPNPAAPSDPLHVVRRTVTTVRRSAEGSSASERQVFERDINGRFVLVRTVSRRSAAD